MWLQYEAKNFKCIIAEISSDEENDTCSDVEIVTIEDITLEEKKEGGKNFCSGQWYFDIWKKKELQEGIIQ